MSAFDPPPMRADARAWLLARPHDRRILRRRRRGAGQSRRWWPIAPTAPNRAASSWRELGDLVARAAAALRRLGVARGDVVAVQLPNWWEFVVAPRWRPTASARS